MTLKSTAWLAILAFLLVAAAGIALRPLTAIDETRYVAVAWEMWQSGDYLVPTRNFEIYTHKPPLLFWSINLIWALTGVSEFAARLIGPLYAVVALILTGVLARRLWPDDPDAGPRATILLAGMAIFAIFGGLTMFDAMLTAATLAGILALLQAIDTGARRWWLILGAFIAMGVLAKGPVILIHLGPAILLAPVWASLRADISWRRMLAGAAIALIAALVVLGFWLVPAIITGGQDYRNAILWTQTAGRISQSFAHARPIWFFAALLPVILFPWIWLPAVWRTAIKANWRDPGLALCAIWGLSALVLFSLISGKQVHYLLPELAAAALILSRLLKDQAAFRPIIPAFLLGVAALVAIAASAGLVPLGNLAAVLTPSTMLLSWGFVVLAVCWLAVQTGSFRGGLILTLGTVVSLNLLIALTGLGPEYDSHRIARILAPYQSAGIAFVGSEYNAEFNFAGRLTKPVATPDTPEALKNWQSEHPGGVIVGLIGRRAPGWRPQAVLSYGSETYGIWQVADAPQPEQAS